MGKMTPNLKKFFASLLLFLQCFYSSLAWDLPPTPGTPLRSTLDISVHVYGQVKSPGVFRLEPGSRVTTAISVANGLKKHASQRRIELRRQNKKPKMVDLVMLNHTGVLENNPFLQNGDVIFVPLEEITVSIFGPVKIPGTFELVQEHSLFDLIHDLCGGFTKGLMQQAKIKIIRYNAEDQKSEYNVSESDENLKSFDLMNGDVIYVPHKFARGKQLDYSIASFPNDTINFPGSFDKISVTGGVKLPEVFEYNPFLKVPNYLALAGGLDRLSKQKVEIIRLDGSRVMTNTSSNIEISPGDVIDVKQKKIAPEFWISFMATLASLGLSSYAILRN